MPFAIVILAAGGSSRLGQPKQLVRFGGKTLVRRSAEIAIQSGAEEVIVILGAQADAVRAELGDLPVKCVINPNWEQGMGGSIAVGVKAMEPMTAVCTVMLCDQPSLTGDHLGRLVQHQAESGAPIVASTYQGVKGVPCAFDKLVFLDLIGLNGDEGARDIIRSGRYRVETVPFEGGLIDIDTQADLDQLNLE